MDTAHAGRGADATHTGLLDEARGPGSRGDRTLAGRTRAAVHEDGAPRRRPVREPAARTYARALPIVPVRARGLTIEGADGRRYLDCLSGVGALALGHNHPVVLDAIRTVLDSGAPLDVPDLATPVKDAFVAELFRTLPPALAAHARVRFCGPDGGDAVQAAFRLVRAATGRTAVIDLTEAGFSTATATATLDAPAALLDTPGPGVPPPAGMILEPVRGDGGVLPVPDAWLRDARRTTAARGVPLIVDESRTGVGRTGAFWAVGHSGVTPDVMVLAKSIGGSLPLAVLVHRDDLDVPRAASRTGPFRGNQLAMAAGTATLAYVREHRLAERAARLGTRMLTRLGDLPKEFPCVAGVRGRGLMIGIELARQDGRPGRAPRSAAPELAAAVQQECLRRGLIVDLGDRHTGLVRLLPPLTITDEQADAVLDRLTDAVRAAAGLSQARERTRR